MKKKFGNLKFFITIILFTLVLGVIGSIWLSKDLLNLYFNQANEEYEYIIKFAKENEEVGNYLIKYAIKINENATKNLAFLIRERISNDTITRDELIELTKNIDFDNIIIIDKKGEIVTLIENKAFDFKDSKYDTLRSVFNGDKKSTMLTMKNNGVTDYYFAAKINDNLEIINYCDGRNIENDSTYIMNWANVLLDKDLSEVITNFIIEKNKEKIIYNSNASYIGKDLDIGSIVLESDKYKLIKLFDKWGYAKRISLEDVDLVSFIKLDAVMRIPIIYMIFTTLAFLICIIFIAVYSAVVSEEANLVKEGFSDVIDKAKYERTRKKKINIITFVSIVVMSFVTLFFSEIYYISAAREGTTYYCSKVKNFATHSNDIINNLNGMNVGYCKINNDFVGTVLQKYPLKLNRLDLSKIAKSLDINEIRILNKEGETICTSNGLDNYKLSKDKNEVSYKCWNLLSEDAFIMLPENEDAKGNIYQYACSTLRDGDNNISGIMMIKYNVEEKHKAEKMIDWYEYTQKALKEKNIFYFMVDKNKEEFVSSSSEELVGQNIVASALPIEVTQSGYEGLISFRGVEFFGKTIQIGEIVTGMFLSMKMIKDSILFVIFVLILFVIGLLILYMFIIIHFSKDYIAERVSLNVENSKEFVINRMFISNWSTITGSQKISLLVSYLFNLLMIIFSIVFLFGEKIFGEESIIYYIINGDWHHSLNVLSFSKCILLISFISLITLIINRLLDFLSHSFDARGITVCKLLANFVRYAAIFVALYQCLSLVGVDTKTLIASAGILSLVIGFGANKLIQEIVSGLFIIFEGSFQVGDTIAISNGGFTGVVKEIGIRNTKIANSDGNVMIISNSDLDCIINHSTAKNLIVYEYKIPIAISLDECDIYFNSKLDYLKKKFGNIVKEIRYDGIVDYEIETYTIRFSILCNDESKVKIEYMIDAEMKFLIKELSEKM